MNAKSSRSVLSTIAVLGVALSMTGCGGGGGSNAAKTNSSTTSATSSAASQDTTGDTGNGSPSSGSSVSTWLSSTSTGGGNAKQDTNVQVMNAVEKDLSAVGQDFADSADDTTLGADCAQLSQDSLAFPQPDSPDATVNDNLKKASDYLISGSVDCNVDNEAASTELNKAIDYINTAVARIKSLG
jgi:hypothetical protein